MYASLNNHETGRCLLQIESQKPQRLQIAALISSMIGPIVCPPFADNTIGACPARALSSASSTEEVPGTTQDTSGCRRISRSTSAALSLGGAVENAARGGKLLLSHRSPPASGFMIMSPTS